MEDSFQITSRSRLECIRDVCCRCFLFISMVDWIIRTSTDGNTNGIQWTLWSQLGDLDFANNRTPLSHSHEQTQTQDNTTCLESKSTRKGLHISTGKTKAMVMQHASESPVTVAGQPLEEVSFFTYLKHGRHTRWDRCRYEGNNR